MKKDDIFISTSSGMFGVSLAIIILDKVYREDEEEKWSSVELEFYNDDDMVISFNFEDRGKFVYSNYLKNEVKPLRRSDYKYFKKVISKLFSASIKYY